MVHRRVLVTALLAVVAIAAAEAGVLVFLRTRAGWQRNAAQTPVVRGREVAEASGCFACHGPGGARPIPNPGSKSGEVPSWTGGTWMMWNNSEADVRAWIVDGHPPDRPPDVDGLVRMPAFGKRLTPTQIDDLVAYVLAVSLFGFPEEPGVVDGREVAVKFGCFGCHGPEGRGLVENPGSFKGYIPPWDGADYPDLVANDEELRQWIRNGISDRFRANPVARRILESQAIVMPAYGDRIGAADLENLRLFIAWVRAHPRGKLHS